MLIPEGGAPSEIVINQCVLQQVVTHVESVYGLTTDGQVRGGPDLPLILEQLQDQLEVLDHGDRAEDLLPGCCSTAARRPLMPHAVASLRGW